MKAVYVIKGGAINLCMISKVGIEFLLNEKLKSAITQAINDVQSLMVCKIYNILCVN